MNAIVPGTESVFIPAEYRVIAGGYQVLTKIDSIVKEEFWRSIGAVYWISFIIIGILIMNDYLPVPLSYIFPLVLILTVAHFLITVWYRRKENLADPNPMSIFRHVLGSKGQGEEGRKRRRVVAGKAVDTALIVVILLIYLSASLAYSSARPSGSLPSSSSAYSWCGLSSSTAASVASLSHDRLSSTS